MAETKNHRAWANLAGWHTKGKSHADSCWSGENPLYNLTNFGFKKFAILIKSHIESDLVWHKYFTQNRCLDIVRGVQPKLCLPFPSTTWLPVPPFPPGHGWMVYHGWDKGWNSCGKDEDSDSQESSQLPPGRPPHQVIPTSAHPFQSTSMQQHSIE